MLTYDGFVHTSIASLGNDIKNRTLIVNGLSKGVCDDRMEDWLYSRP